jgi:hypothetical protein
MLFKILVNDNSTRNSFFLICLFKCSTCFDQPRAHHQEYQPYQYNVWYMSLKLVLRAGSTVCPTRYRTRHFFNNSNTNEDTATKFEKGWVRCVRNEEECVCSVSVVRLIVATWSSGPNMPGTVASVTPYVSSVRRIIIRRAEDIFPALKISLSDIYQTLYWYN